MSFKLSWTSANGFEQILVPDAEEAMQKYAILLGTVVNLVVKDGQGNRVSYDDLATLSIMKAN